MRPGTSKVMRIVRSALLAGLTGCAAGVAHTAGGGSAGSTGLLAALALAGTPVVYAMSARRWRLPHLVMFMALAQLVAHAAMTAAMPAGHHVTTAADVSAAAPDTRMFGAHAVMTLMFSAALAYGESVLFWTLTALTGSLPTLLPTPALRRPRPEHLPVARPCGVVISACKGSRAPPVLVTT